jgi:hypothetical protein
MEGLELNLYNLIGNELNELAWNKNYPINSSIGLHCFFEAFKGQGFKVSIDDECKQSTFVLKNMVGGKPNFLEASLSHNQILIGWKRAPKSCLHSLYDSICNVYDSMGEQLKISPRDYELSNKWYLYRNSNTKEVRKKMEEEMIPFFRDYQENMFISMVERTSNLEKPILFFELIKEFPMTILEKAVINNLFEDTLICGPCPETLLELDLDKDLNPDNYFPSESTMVSFFVGHYLDRLSRLKKYPLNRGYGYDEKDRLKCLVDMGRNILEDGAHLKWLV